MAMTGEQAYVLAKSYTDRTTGGGGGSGGADNYNLLKNLPMIEGKTLKGNLSLEDIGAQPAGNYLTSEELMEIIPPEEENLDFSNIFTQ